MSVSSESYNMKPTFYATYFYMLREIALEKGYALAIHGSVTRDFDLIAIPWVDEVSSHEELLGAFRDIIGIERPLDDGKRYVYDTIERKPHGRIAYTLQCGGGMYFDISIMSVESKE